MRNLRSAFPRKKQFMHPTFSKTSGGFAMFRVGMIVLCLALSLFGCSKKEGTAKSERGSEEVIVNAYEMLGKTAEELREMLGVPDSYRSEQKSLTEHLSTYGYMTWLDINDVKVFVTIRGKKAHYVTFTFTEETDFDERKLLARLGLRYPSTEPQVFPPAKRWEPYEQYDRLTINSKTKMISLGSRVPTKGLR